jgi:hypothetical protein
MGGSRSGHWGSRHPLVDSFLRIDLAQVRRDHQIAPGAAMMVSYGQMRSTVYLTQTPMRFGGSRLWFRCPSCGGRCRVLYGSSRRLACWRCQRLRYRSQVEAQADRALRGMQKIARRLDPEADDIWMPPKPPRMHWRTYDRLVDKYKTYDTRWARMALRCLRLA